MKLLFVLKYREQPYDVSATDWAYSHTGKPLSSGLFNSANMIVKMLNESGHHEAKIVHVRDGNDIHRECVAYKPDATVIEAFWCPPYKFDDLYKALPNMKFIVRNHSETPFLANEGIAFGWMMEYIKKPNVFMAPNSPRMVLDTKILLRAAGREDLVEKVLYLPNYYSFGQKNPGPKFARRKDVVDVGCFGAVRPLKNHVLQAVAALEYANKHHVKLNFHINGNRVEGNGAPILKNLRQLFEQFPEHNLVEHEWTDAQTFREMLRTLDVVMQVSFSETFNIVAADAVDAGIPVVGSKEIPWLTNCMKADPTSVGSIYSTLSAALGMFGPVVAKLNRWKLNRSNSFTEHQWDFELSML